MSMNKYFKEIDYIESYIKKRKLDTSFKSNLKLLAKYYVYLSKKEDSDIQIESEEDLEKLLYKFCEKKCKSWFNPVLHYRMIDNAVKFGMDKANIMIQIDKVNVTKSEFEYINSLSEEFSYLEKKILFTMLVINKANNIRNNIRGNESNYYFSGGEYGYKQLLETLGEKLTRTYKVKGIHETIKKFNDNELTRTTNKLSLELLYLKEIEKDNEIVMEVIDFDDIGLYWNILMGKTRLLCCSNTDCNNRYLKKGKNAKFCSVCAKKRELEKYKKYNKRR